MRKQIKKLFSKVTATALALATMISPMAPSMEVRAEEAPSGDAVYLYTLGINDVQYTVKNGILTVIDINDIDSDWVLHGDELLEDYNNSNEGKSRPASKLIVRSSANSKGKLNVRDANVVIVEDDTTAELNLYSNVRITNAEGAKIGISDISFAPMKALMGADISGLLDVYGRSTTAYLSKTFMDCSKLQLVSIYGDPSSHTAEFSFNSAFKNCPSLSNVTIQGLKIKDLVAVTGYGAIDESVPVSPTFVFNNCTFTDPAEDAYKNAFNGFSGRIEFDSCLGNFTLSNFVNGPLEPTGDLELIIDEDTKVTKLDSLVSDGAWKDVTLNVKASSIEEIDVLFDSTVEAKGVNLSGFNTLSLKTLRAPFYGLELPTPEVETTAINSFLGSLNLSTVTTLDTIGVTENNSYSDLSNLTLTEDPSAVYYESSNKLGLSSYYLPNQFTTAKSFGGTYVAPYILWEVLGENSFNKVPADSSREYPLVNTNSTIEGFQYNNGTLKNATEYTFAKATVIFKDVATGTERTSQSAGGTKVSSFIGYDATQTYFTDEALTTPLDVTRTVEEDETLRVYYTSTGTPTIPDEPTVPTVDKTIGFEVRDVEESAYPISAKVKWTMTDTTGVTKDGSANVEITSSTCTVTVKVPSYINEGVAPRYTFSAEADGYDVTEDMTGTGMFPSFIVKPSQVEDDGPTEPEEPTEPDYSIVCNLPSKWGAEFIGDVTTITATLEDGTTRKLGQDGDIITIGGCEIDTPEAYAQTSDFSLYNSRLFIQPSITIKNGDNTYNVKSIDGTLLFNVTKDNASFDDRKFSAYSYNNGISKTPMQVESNVNYANTSGDAISMLLNNMVPTVILYHGQAYTNSHYIYNITLNWKDTGNESKRPDVVNGSFTATYSKDLTSSNTFTVNKDVTKHTQTVQVSVPKSYNLEGTYDLDSVVFELEDIDNYTVEYTTGKYTQFDLTYNPSTPEGPSEPDEPTEEPVVENIPEGAEIVFGDDAEDITATLEDGTMKPLVSGTTQLIVNVNEKKLSGYNAPDNKQYDVIKHYDVTLKITDGTSTWNVKSVDSTIGIVLPLPDDCAGKGTIKVYHYEDGIMNEPKEVKDFTATSTHITIPTTSYSYYALTYDVANVETKTLTINWDDAGYTEERPTSVVADWTATYADNSTQTGSIIFNKDTSVTKQSKDFEVPKTNNSSELVSVTAEIRNVTSYSVVKSSDPLTFTMKYVGTSATTVFTTFKFLFINDTAAVRPNEVTFKVTAIYDDMTRDTRDVTCKIGSTGTGTVKVEFPIKNDLGSNYNMITWEYPTIEGYERTSSGETATYSYVGGNGNTVQTEFPVTINFNGDSANTAARPTQVSVNWSATYTDGSETQTGTLIIPVTTTANSFTQSITIPNPTGKARTVVFTGPTLTNYVLTTNGSTLTYSYREAVSTSSKFEIKFEDESNKAGRRPAELKVTLTDKANSGNTITSTLTIKDNTTTTTNTYTSSVSIPAGTTYSITKVEELPTGYKATYEGMTAILKYTPETVDKTYKVVWEGDVEETRPSSVTLKIKSGSSEEQSVNVTKDTNWAANVKLQKYIKGVEASYSVEASSVTNYTSSVSGETVTFKYTGTLTEAQKDAINANSDKEDKDEVEEDLYNYEKFDWIDYANRYPDVKKAFGYNKEALYAHYIHYGIAEGRYATFFGKYENVNEEILAAYFPNDYKYLASGSGSSAEQMKNELEGNTPGGSSSTSTNSNVTVDENGNTIIKQDNGDGTTTETIIDKDGNVVQTKTYATGDFRMENTLWLYVAILVVTLAIGGISFTEFRKSNKTKKFLNDFIQS